MAQRCTYHRSTDTASSHGQLEEAEIQRAFLQGGEVSEYHFAEDIQSAPSKALQDATTEHDGHGIGHGKNDGAKEEEEESDVQGDFATEDVAEVGVDWLSDDKSANVGKIGPKGFEGRSM